MWTFDLSLVQSLFMDSTPKPLLLNCYASGNDVTGNVCSGLV